MWNEIQESLQLLWDKLGSWLDGFILLLPNLIVAIVVALISAFLVKYVQKYIRKFASNFVRTKSIINLIASAGAIALWIVTAFVCLNILNLDTALKSLLAGAGVVGLAIGLALQDPIMNTFSGIMLSVKDYYNIDDLVKTNDYMGHICVINLRYTSIRLLTGEIVVIPNKDILHSPLINYSLGGRRRVILDCGVGYGDDLQQVEDVTKQTIKNSFEHIKSEDDVEFFYTEFGNSSINFKVRFWLDIDSRLPHLEAKGKAIKEIKKAYDENGFNIPFPIRTLDVSTDTISALAEKINIKSNDTPNLAKNSQNGTSN